MTYSQVFRETIAEKIYTDWNKGPRYTWKTLPEYRKQSYRDWVDEEILARLPSIEEARKQGIRTAVQYLKVHLHIQVSEGSIKEIEKACLEEEPHGKD